MGGGGSERGLLRDRVLDDGNHDAFYHVCEDDVAAIKRYLGAGGDVQYRVRLLPGCCPAK